MTERPYDIGDQVHFIDRHGATREGRIVGVELIDNPRIGRRGWNFTIRTELFEWLTMHASQITGRVVQRQESAIYG